MSKSSCSSGLKRQSNNDLIDNHSVDNGSNSVSDATVNDDTPLSSSISLLMEQNPNEHKYLHFGSGILSGLLVGGLLSPYDKALYLSVKYRRSFAHADNWHRPYFGALQTIAYRCASQGLYFPMETLSRSFMFSKSPALERHPFYCNLLGGVIAGGMCAVFLNPIQTIRYSAWISHRPFWAEVNALYAGRGFVNFYRGTPATVYRDVIFGGTFAAIRHFDVMNSLRVEQWLGTDAANERRNHWAQKSLSFSWNMFASFVATTLSSPFNYVRNMQYSTEVTVKPMSTLERLKELFIHSAESKAAKSELKLARWSHMGVRLKIGWGTTRVALGMALGAEAYGMFVRYFERHIVS